MMPHGDSPRAADLAGLLLEWFAAARRDLPWRRNRDPYAVWISEVMLQQTQAATVIPYFESWLARFPDVPALAAAPLDDVLRAWEGLGYYARARNLRRTARVLVDQHQGQLPADRKSLLALPGIGCYTAAAILSLAFGHREAVLDGNVRRVLCRVYDIDRDPRAPAVERWLWDLARGLVDAVSPEQAGAVNESLMELGALICTPRAPACASCPLTLDCLAHRHGSVDQRPVRTSKPKTPHYDVVAAVLRDETGRHLIVRRHPRGLLGGLWGFPGGIVLEGESLVAGLARTVSSQLGIVVHAESRLLQVRHAYTHFRITLSAYHSRHVAGEAQALACAEVRWVRPEELDAYPLAVTDRKIAQRIVESAL